MIDEPALAGRSAVARLLTGLADDVFDEPVPVPTAPLRLSCRLESVASSTDQAEFVRHLVRGDVLRGARPQPAADELGLVQVVQGRSFAGLRIAQMCLMRSSEMSKAMTASVTPSRWTTSPG